MKPSGPVTVGFASFVLLAGSVLAACGVVQNPGSQPTTSPTPMASPPGTLAIPTLVPSPSIAPSPSLAAPSPNAAEAACSAILDNIPLVIVNSGKPTVAAAFEVTGAQLTNYFVRTLNDDPNHSNGSDWWGQPTKLVDLCLYDGDFTTMAPVPSGSDTSAIRVLVVIFYGEAEFWASTLDTSTIPAVDPATIPEPTPIETSPTPATPSPTPSPIAGFSRFPGHGFWFDYPSDWRFLEGFHIYGIDGPTILAAVGIGNFDDGCKYQGNNLTCQQPHRSVPKDGIVLDYRIAPNIGYWPAPTLKPGDAWVTVGGRSALLSKSADEMTWQFLGLPEYIEVQWGPQLSGQAPDLVAQVMASWYWGPNSYNTN